VWVPQVLVLELSISMQLYLLLGRLRRNSSIYCWDAYVEMAAARTLLIKRLCAVPDQELSCFKT